MKKILFFVPPHATYDDYVRPAFNARIVHKKNGDFGSLLTDMPLGVLSLSGYLKKSIDVQTKLIDFNIELNKIENFDFDSFEDFFQNFLSSPEFADFNPDIVGISALFTTCYQSMLALGHCCRDIFPNSLIIAGGGIPTNLYRKIFADSRSFDALCYGEGEKPLLKLLKAEDTAQFLKNNSSWITPEKINLKQSFQYDFVENLDEIPFFDYEICKMNDYGLNPATTAYAGVNQKTKNFHVMTSRGCTNRCCFCASHTVHGRKMRFYSTNRISEDLQRLKTQYGAHTIIVQDDHLMTNKKRALEVIEIIKSLDLTAVFQNGLALYALDRKMLEAIKSAGVNQLMLSVESGSDRVLRDIMHKPLNLNIVKRVAKDCRELDIYTNVNILIGLPGETKNDLEDARAFLKTINANWFMIFCANPLVGSEMFKICIEKNYLKGDYIGSDYKKAVIETEDFTSEFIQEMAYKMNLELNFVNNSDYRLGNYEVALKGFKNAIRARDDHALAYFYAAKCYEKINDLVCASAHMEKAKLYAKNPFWRKYMDMFNIKLSNLTH